MSVGNLPSLTPSKPPRNPLSNGNLGRIATILTIGAITLTAIFFGLDTLQFVVTGKESYIFQQVARGFGAIGLGSLVVMLIKSYIQRSDK